jgi:hypothetical protein
MIKTKMKVFLAAFLLITLMPLQAFAADSILPGFDSNRLIDDADFSNKNAMGSAAAVQKFLESKNSVLANTSADFIAKLKEPTNSELKKNLDDPNHNSNGRTAAQLIWDASQASGINPQVTLVTLQKEQSLITGRQNATAEQLQRALDIALGFGCPDSGGCEGLYVGFYFQLFGNYDSEGNRYLGATKSLMKSFTTPGGRGPYYNGKIAKVGDTIILGNTLGGYEGVQAEQRVTIENAATAALYRYTPHVFNGNYNFWRYMSDWFGSTPRSSGYADGTLLKYKKVYYIVQSGSKYKLNDFVIKARKINVKRSATVSTKQFNKIPDGGLYGLADNTLVKTEKGYYIFLSNKKYSITETLIKQRGLSISKAVETTEADIKDYPTGTQLLPPEGTVLKGKSTSEVYIVENAQLRLISSTVLQQRGLTSQIQTISDEELASYPKGGYLVPADGSMVKSQKDATVYLIANRIRRPIPSLLVFKTYGRSFADIQILGNEELEAIPKGSFAEPKDSTYYKIASTGELYIYRNASRHYISSFVAKQRSITPDVTLELSESNAWPEGEPIVPKDGTLVKADNGPAVYIVEGGKMKALSGADFKARGLSFTDVQILPAKDVAKFLTIK